MNDPGTMRVLFVHQNFPGQYKHLARRLASSGVAEVVGMGDVRNAARQTLPDVVCAMYRASATPSSSIHRYLATTQAAVTRGEAVASACVGLARRGFVPDVVFAHAGWGEALYLRDVFPRARVVSYMEFHYGSTGGDTGFDPEFPVSFDDRLRLRTWNMVQHNTFFSSDWSVSPTHWQASTFPDAIRRRLSVIHEGVDTRALRPDPDARHALPDGRVLTRADEVVTFVNRGLEPYRGFHVFMRALPELLARRPRARVVVVGGDEPSYGRPPRDAASWREKMLAEVGKRLPLERVHFVGKLAYPSLVTLLRVSRAHVYLTYPFVLSWSMLEAMALGAPVVASRTAPVSEVIEDGRSGLLFDFFDRDAFVDAVCRVLEDAGLARALAEGGRAEIVARYDLNRVCLPAYLGLLRRLVEPQTVHDAMRVSVGAPGADHRSGTGDVPVRAAATPAAPLGTGGRAIDPTVRRPSVAPTPPGNH